jgi:cytochrome c-type biogenesis protein CcmH
MRSPRRLVSALSALAFATGAAVGCDRAVESYDPAEQPQQPDLSRIFPEGAERSAQPAPVAQGGATGSRGAPPVASPTKAIQGTVTVAEALSDRVPAGAVLFLIARSAESGPPLAVRRIDSPRFPLDFTIGPDDRMIASMPFAGPIRLTVRVDSDGNVTTRSPGDLQGAAEGGFHPGDTGVALVLDESL